MIVFSLNFTSAKVIKMIMTERAHRINKTKNHLLFKEIDVTTVLKIILECPLCLSWALNEWNRLR